MRWLVLCAVLGALVDISVGVPTSAQTTINLAVSKPAKASQSNESNFFSLSNSLASVSADPKSPKNFLVAVCSAPNHFDERQAIRRTWAKLGSTAALTYDVLFFVGKIRQEDANHKVLEEKLFNEAKESKDVVFSDSFIESYSNLTRKTLAMISFAAAKNYEVMMKVDDDSFVLLDNFIYDVLLYEPERPLLYWGKFWGSDDRPVSRAVGSKYFMSEQEYAPSTFPNYADGPCYALGRDLLKWIDSKQASNALSLYTLEDAAVGIWLNSAPLAVKAIYGDAYMYQRVCREGNTYYFVNPVNPAEMGTIMAHYSKHEDICSDNYSLAVCSSKDKGCLCSPSDNPCWDTQK